MEKYGETLSHKYIKKVDVTKPHKYIKKLDVTSEPAFLVIPFQV